MITKIVDTNIFIRLFTQDVESQYQKAKIFFNKVEKRKAKAKISLLIINEIIWIMDNYYNAKRTVYLPELIKILSFENINIIELKKAKLIEILKKLQTINIDFTDIYLSEIATNSNIFTFDKDFKRLK